MNQDPAIRTLVATRSKQTPTRVVALREDILQGDGSEPRNERSRGSPNITPLIAFKEVGGEVPPPKGGAQGYCLPRASEPTLPKSGLKRKVGRRAVCPPRGKEWNNNNSITTCTSSVRIL